MSPEAYSSVYYGSLVFRVEGIVEGWQYLTSGWVNNIEGVRPVINLKANTTFSKGDGSIDSPYEIL